MSMENIPFIRGLSTASGLTLIPGTWIQDINLSKGAGTAVNGPNAMTGQIDLCLLNPLNEGPLFVNVYGNSQGRAEVNVHAAQRTGANSATSCWCTVIGSIWKWTRTTMASWTNPEPGGST